LIEAEERYPLHNPGEYSPPILLINAARKTVVALIQAGVICAHSTSPTPSLPERLSRISSLDW
jgi:hypothetical protein